MGKSKKNRSRKRKQRKQNQQLDPAAIWDASGPPKILYTKEHKKEDQDALNTTYIRFIKEKKNPIGRLRLYFVGNFVVMRWEAPYDYDGNSINGVAWGEVEIFDENGHLKEYEVLMKGIYRCAQSYNLIPRFHDANDFRITRDRIEQKPYTYLLMENQGIDAASNRFWKNIKGVIEKRKNYIKENGEKWSILDETWVPTEEISYYIDCMKGCPKNFAGYDILQTPFKTYVPIVCFAQARAAGARFEGEDFLAPQTRIAKEMKIQEMRVEFREAGSPIHAEARGALDAVMAAIDEAHTKMSQEKHTLLTHTLNLEFKKLIKSTGARAVPEVEIAKSAAGIRRVESDAAFGKSIMEMMCCHTDLLNKWCNRPDVTHHDLIHIWRKKFVDASHVCLEKSVEMVGEDFMYENECKVVGDNIMKHIKNADFFLLNEAGY